MKGAMRWGWAVLWLLLGGALGLAAGTYRWRPVVAGYRLETRQALDLAVRNQVLVEACQVDLGAQLRGGRR